MALNDQLDDQAADFRDVQPEEASIPEIPQPIVNNNSLNASVSTGNHLPQFVKSIIVGIFVVVIGVLIYYFGFYQPAPTPMIRPKFCPNGQPYPKTPPCPSAPADAK